MTFTEPHRVLGMYRTTSFILLLFTLTACSRQSEQSKVASAGNVNSISSPTQDSEKILNVYSWLDYIAPDTVANFEKETGIKVRYDTYDNNEVLETKLLLAHK